MKQQKKNILPGRNNIYIIFFLIVYNLFIYSLAKGELVNNFVEIKLLDKVNSKNSTLILKLGEEKKFQNLIIKALRCNNSEFDDNPDTVAYLQVKDITLKDKDKVFIFNDWTFSSSPSIKPFDHPIYDIWLSRCFN